MKLQPKNLLRAIAIAAILLLARPVPASSASATILPVPQYSQFDATLVGRWQWIACGPTSVRMVLAYYGHPVPLLTLVKATGIASGAGGAATYELIALLEAHGVRTQLGLLTYANVVSAIDAGDPLLVTVRPGNLYGVYLPGLYHTVVVVGYIADGVVVNDPYYGRHTFAWRRFFYAANIYAIYTGERE